MLSHLSLIIPTFNRQKYAIRNMKYWSGSQVTVYVLDGSQSPIGKSQLNQLSSNIKYFHMQCSCEKRLLFGINQVSTDFCVLLSDDEYHLPSALNKCILELIADPFLAACTGRALGINFQNGRIVGYPVYPEMANYEISNIMPAERVISNFSPYQVASFYSVSRTTALKTALKCVADNEYSPYNIGELQLEIAMKYQGKFKVLPFLMWLRSDECVPIRATDSPEKLRSDDYSVEYWWPNQSYKEDHGKFIDSIVQNLSTSIQDQEYLKGIVVDAMDAYVRQCNISFKSRIYRKMRKILPNFLLDSVKYFLLKIRQTRLSPKSSDSLFDAAVNLLNEGVFVDLNELKKVESSISDFYNVN